MGYWAIGGGAGVEVWVEVVLWELGFWLLKRRIWGGPAATCLCLTGTCST